MFLFKSNTHGQLGSIIGVIEFAKSISFCNNLAPLWFSRGLIAPITDKSWTKILISGLQILELGKKTDSLTLIEFILIQTKSAGGFLMAFIRFTQTLPQLRQITWSKNQDSFAASHTDCLIVETFIAESFHFLTSWFFRNLIRLEPGESGFVD